MGYEKLFEKGYILLRGGKVKSRDARIAEIVRVLVMT